MRPSQLSRASRRPLEDRIPSAASPRPAPWRGPRRAHAHLVSAARCRDGRRCRLGRARRPARHPHARWLDRHRRGGPGPHHGRPRAARPGAGEAPAESRRCAALYELLCRGRRPGRYPPPDGRPRNGLADRDGRQCAPHREHGPKRRAHRRNARARRPHRRAAPRSRGDACRLGGNGRGERQLRRARDAQPLLPSAPESPTSSTSRSGRSRRRRLHSLFDRKTDTAIDFTPDARPERDPRAIPGGSWLTMPVPGNAHRARVPGLLHQDARRALLRPRSTTACSAAPDVWSSWTSYYEAVREEDIVKNADWLGANLKPLRLPVCAARRRL